MASHRIDIYNHGVGGGKGGKTSARKKVVDSKNKIKKVINGVRSGGKTMINGAMSSAGGAGLALVALDVALQTVNKYVQLAVTLDKASTGQNVYLKNKSNAWNRASMVANPIKMFNQWREDKIAIAVMERENERTNTSNAYYRELSGNLIAGEKYRS